MEMAQGLLSNFNDIKTLPSVHIRLSRLISDEKSSLRDFEEVIKLDPTLVLRMLKIANSAYFGLRQKVTNIARAVLFIGMKNLRNMIVVEAMRSIFKNGHDSDLFSRSRLWLHCSAVSICGQMISERIFGKNGENAFLCGILHDIGMIVEDQVAPEGFLRACQSYDPKSGPITQYEKTILGTDHCEVGYFLAKDWNVPEEVRIGIRSHHSRIGDLAPSSITGILQAAEYIVIKLNYPAFPGMKGILSPYVAEHLQQNLDEYKTLAKDLPNEMSKAKEIYDMEQ